MCPEAINHFCTNCGRYGVRIENCPRCSRIYHLRVKRSASMTSVASSNRSGSSKKGQETISGSKRNATSKKLASVVVRAGVNAPGFGIDGRSKVVGGLIGGPSAGFGRCSLYGFLAGSPTP